MKDVMIRMEHRVQRTHTYTHTHIGTHQQRRTTLVVDLQDKYYSEKLDYRYRPPPNANNCVSDRSELPVTCVQTRARNFRDYHPDLLLQHPIFPFSFLGARPRYHTNLRYISTTVNNFDIMTNMNKSFANI